MDCLTVAALPRVQLVPVGIRFFDQLDLPLAIPLFHRLFTVDRIADIGEPLEPHQPVHAVFRREAGNRAGFVLLDPKRESAGDADVERPARLAREDVDIGAFGHFPHPPNIVVPAQAGTHLSASIAYAINAEAVGRWVPAFRGDDKNFYFSPAPR